MRSLFGRAVVYLLVGMWVTISSAEEVTSKEIKGLGAQVQDIKTELLDISSGIIQLEEKFIYLANNRISIFVAMAQADKFRLDTVTIRIDGKDAVRHAYSPKELQALQLGGVQRVYDGNIGSGMHALDVAFSGKSTDNKEFRQNASHKFSKAGDTKIIQITFSEPHFYSRGILINE